MITAHEAAYARPSHAIETSHTDGMRAAYAVLATLPVNATPRARMAAFTAYAAVREAQITVLQAQVKALLAARRQGAVDALLAALPPNVSERRVALYAVIDVAKAELRKLAPDAKARATVDVVKTDDREVKDGSWSALVKAHAPHVHAHLMGKGASVNMHAIAHAYVPYEAFDCRDCVDRKGRAVYRAVAGFAPRNPRNVG